MSRFDKPGVAIPARVAGEPGTHCGIRAASRRTGCVLRFARALAAWSVASWPVAQAQCPTPHASNDFTTTQLATPVTITPTTNDTGSLGNDPIVIVNGPSHGVANYAGGLAMSYTPSIESTGPYCGSDTIVYHLVDNCGTPSNDATFTIQVHGPTVGPAVNDTYSSDQMTVLGSGVCVLDIPFLGNDYYQSPVPQVVIVTPPQHGTVSSVYGSSTQFQYTATSFGCEGDSFSYRLGDDLHCGQSNVATVTILPLQADCNRNGIPDVQDAAAPGADLDGNGVPDVCELSSDFSSTCAVIRSSSGERAFGTGSDARLSGNGRFVAFTSNAASLGPPHIQWDSVWLRDRWLGTTEVLPRTITGGYTTYWSRNADVSDDGRFAVFSSPAPNLTQNDVGGNEDVFLRDRLLGTTTLVTRTSSGVQANASSYHARISADGGCVAFRSAASNLVPNDTNGKLDVFRWERATGLIQLVSHNASGASANGWSGEPAISADGRYVAFSSDATDLIPGDTNGAQDVFVFDAQSGLVQRVSKSSQGLQADSDSYEPAISADGRFAAFSSWAANLVPGDSNQVGDVFLHDRLHATTVRVSVGALGQQLTEASWAPHVSSDGVWVSFSSYDAGLVAGDTNGQPDVFRKNMITGVVDRCSVNTGGFQTIPTGQWSVAPTDISDDGHTVAFESDANTLDGQDCGLFSEVFVRSQRPLHTEGMCFGDGSAGACPCSNAGLPGNGCGSSANPSGANLSGSGISSVSADTLDLVASGLTPAAPTLFLQYTHVLNAGQGLPSGDGLRCFNGALIRLGVVTATGNSSTYPSPGAQRISVKGLLPASGGTRYYAAYYRDPAPFCTSLTHNMTNGLRVLWFP